MDLEKVVVDMLKEKIEGGLIEKIASEKLDKFLNEVLSNCLSNYGANNKALTARISESIGNNIKEIPIEAYTKLIVESIKNKLDSHSEEQLKIVDKFVEETFGKNIKKKYKIEDIIQDFVKYQEDEDDYNELFTKDMSLHIKEDGKSIHIKCDPKPDQERYECRYSFFFYDGKLASAKGPAHSHDDVGRSVFLNVLEGRGHDFSKVMFQVLSRDLEIDLSGLHYIDTSYGDY